VSQVVVVCLSTCGTRFLGSSWCKCVEQSGKCTKQEKWAYVKELSDADVAYMDAMPFSLHLPSRSVAVVHAGFVPGIALADQDLFNLYKVRMIIHCWPGFGPFVLPGNDGCVSLALPGQWRVRLPQRCAI
jgi:hypothetical protein